MGRLHLKSAQELARGLLSDNLLEASIGIAALNSLLDIDENSMEETNAADVIAREAKDRNLAIVGHFPFIERMASVTRNCWVIEKRPVGDDFPEDRSRDLIPQADVVAITGTAFINHTIEELLALCRPTSLVLILGPSTPLTPLLFKYGVSFISGTRIVDEAAAETTILQGATFQQLDGARLWTMTRKQ